MPRAKALLGPSRLSQVLKHLKQFPKPTLSPLKSLSLTLASKNDHFGARHFTKEDLPRIQYANPELDIKVSKIPRSVGDKWKAEMLLEFKNGTSKTLDVSDKWSTAIFEELMDTAGGDRWRQYKAERKIAGTEPVVPDVKPNPVKPVPPSPPPPPKKGVAAALA